jgi:hypothetical protein
LTASRAAAPLWPAETQFVSANTAEMCFELHQMRWERKA